MLRIRDRFERLYRGEVRRVPTFVPMSRESRTDGEAMTRDLGCAMWLMGWDLDPVTLEEERTGWRDRVHGDHSHRVAVSWRADQMRREADATREAERAACPYVACTCGHHEE